MHILPINVMLDFICMGPVDLPGALASKGVNIQDKKLLLMGLEPQPCDLYCVALPTELPGLS